MESTEKHSMFGVNPMFVVLALVVWFIGGVIAFFYGGDWFMPPAASAEAEAVDNLFRFMLGIATFIFLMVETCVFYFGIRYGLMRNKQDDTDGPPIHGNSTIEIVWTLIPAFIVFVLTIYSLQVLVDTTEARPDEQIIGVTAQQFFWQFNYEVQRGDETYELSSNHVLVVPKDQVVRLEMASQDVIHAFWVPEFRVKQDVMPGRITEVRFTPTVVTGLPEAIGTEASLLESIDDYQAEIGKLQTVIDEVNIALESELSTDAICEPFTVVADTETDVDATTEEGVADDDLEDVVPVNVGGEQEGDSPPVTYAEEGIGFPVVCTELCGANHGLMRGVVFVVEREVYEIYIENLRLQEERNQLQQQVALACGGAAVAEAGRLAFEEHGCQLCHQLDDAGSYDMGQGPSLNTIAEDAERLAAELGYESAEDYIQTSILNPDAYVVPGYPDTLMPENFIDRIPPDQLQLLVAYLAMDK